LAAAGLLRGIGTVLPVVSWMSVLLFVYATLERSLSLFGEGDAVDGDAQGAIVVVLKPIGDVVQAYNLHSRGSR